jgi:hypothetical protein
MFVVVRSPKIALISLAVSVGIFLILYFTVIKPDNNAANNAIRSSEQQAQQVLNQAAKTGGVNQAAKTGGVPAGVTNLVGCIAAAGTNTGQIQACQAKFKP